MTSSVHTFDEKVTAGKQLEASSYHRGPCPLVVREMNLRASEALFGQRDEHERICFDASLDGSCSRSFANGLSAADAFYAQINGENTTHHSATMTTVTDCASLDRLSVPSFADGSVDIGSNLSPSVDAEVDEAKFTALLDASTTSSSFTIMSSFVDFDIIPDFDIGGRIKNKRHKSPANRRKDPKSKQQHRHKIPKSGEQPSAVKEEGEEALTSNEIKSLIIQHLPKELLAKIDNEVMDQLFESLSENEPRPFDAITIPTSLTQVTEEPEDETATTVSELSFQLETPPQAKVSSDDRWKLFENESKSGSTDFTAPEFSHMQPPTKPKRQISAETKLKSVAFDTVRVRFYERVPEVNPSVSSGVAIGIGWRYKRGKLLSVEDWESQKVGLGRQGRDLVLSRHVREQMLCQAGFTAQDIAQATREIIRAKNQRKKTFENMATTEMIENAARRIKRFVSLKGILR